MRSSQAKSDLSCLVTLINFSRKISPFLRVTSSTEVIIKVKISKASSNKLKEEGYKSYQKEDEKIEKKLLGDSGYGYNYIHGKNHFSKEGMLRKMNEKKEKSKDKAYYTENIEDLCKSKPTWKALTIAEYDSDDGQVEVWSIDSEDENVRMPTHGECFVVKESKFDKESCVRKGGKCLIFGSISS